MKTRKLSMNHQHTAAGGQRLSMTTILGNLKANRISRPEYIISLLSSLQKTELHPIYDKWGEGTLRDNMGKWHEERYTCAYHHDNDEAITFAFQLWKIIDKMRGKEGKAL